MGKVVLQDGRAKVEMPLEASLEARVSGWLRSEGMDYRPPKPPHLTPSLLAFVKKEIAAALVKAADEAHENAEHTTRDWIDAEVRKLERE